MPYFRCPNCALLVHLATNDSAEVACSRCRVQLQEELTLPPHEELAGFIGHTARGPRGSSPS
jgi:uncharacterized paraquat-inducible protein A